MGAVSQDTFPQPTGEGGEESLMHRTPVLPGGAQACVCGRGTGRPRMSFGRLSSPGSGPSVGQGKEGVEHTGQSEGPRASCCPGPIIATLGAGPHRIQRGCRPGREGPGSLSGGGGKKGTLPWLRAPGFSSLGFPTLERPTQKPVWVQICKPQDLVLAPGHEPQTVFQPRRARLARLCFRVLWAR